MTKFHVTLDGVKNDKLKTPDLRSQLSARGGGISKGRKAARPSIEGRWQHDMYDEAEQSEPFGSTSSEGSDLRSRLGGGKSGLFGRSTGGRTKGLKTVASRLGG
eukprot:CAMPEP_0118922836 /NCGR_PEP_ID=MMETSP1169-20130426/1616_1 /TAXON_ID=36882 /ORGANISM="Pyramimonas obovata, Strain CCMP722" /LENGTH=103 /DNA_ID=CAMNT_0006863761 /DNA_START=95 /DNA_END=402 /DNA_ORIENTATION=-